MCTHISLKNYFLKSTVPVVDSIIFRIIVIRIARPNGGVGGRRGRGWLVGRNIMALIKKMNDRDSSTLLLSEIVEKIAINGLWPVMPHRLAGFCCEVVQV